jgi:ATP-binding cassette, subfamily F, member 3
LAHGYKFTEFIKALGNPDIYSDRARFVQAEADYNKALAELAEANTAYEAAFERVMELEG